ncbi:glycosyltransferase [Cellulosimicrobium protaetiae]|uniref:Glycosyltransferase n=1 Tax=Cellulosimicrobium protaetiae TaxID=2587808 RepID=A0A6M5UH78_9MICO|nr:glycosyltransferase [Cellulosimicrobium protaetiae]QJW35979.1 glycosyltransferase [Cellulosimicrobium protaetiae]
MEDAPRRADDLPRVTVIIPVYNDVERLRLCLDALAQQDYPADRLDVVVVDNASTVDLRPALPDDDRFVMVRELRKGSYAARNAGLEVATGEVLAFTDADCRPWRDWLSTAVAMLKAPGAPDAVGGRIRLVFRDGPEPTTGPELYESVHGFDQERFVTTFHFAATANLVATSEAVRGVGGFDPALQSGGDDDFGHRLAASGRRLAYAPDAVVDHPSRPSWSELTTKSVRIAKGMADLSASGPLREAGRAAVGELRAGTSVWLTIWRKPWPTTPRGRAGYAAALSWVSVIRLATWTPRLVRRSLRRG